MFKYTFDSLHTQTRFSFSNFKIFVHSNESMTPYIGTVCAKRPGIYFHRTTVKVDFGIWGNEPGCLGDKSHQST